jgi:hypothetical protein
MSLRVRPYQPADRDRWNAFVKASRNGTFLLEREYMDYHADRFVDLSLVVEDDAEWIAALPASRHDHEARSHGGLTYGGFLIDDAMSAPRMLDAFTAVVGHLADAGITKLLYKTIPWIYHRQPSEEDRYALFRLGAARVRTDVLTVVTPRARLPVQERRRRAINKAKREGIECRSTPIPEAYWDMLTTVLATRHATRPTHSFAEIKRLEASFPEQIVFYGAHLGDELLAGIVVYQTPQVAHAQYISSSEAGRERGALDWLIEWLLTDRFRDTPFFDFGISSDQNGQILNVGLAEYKEGFGGRTVVHDFFELSVGG